MRRFASVFASRRDKQPPPPLVTDHAHSSASSSSGSASLYLHTPDDDQHHLEVVDRRSSSKKSWKAWLKGSPKPPLPPPTKHWQNPTPIPDWTSPHELDDTQSEPSVEDDQAPQDPCKIFVTLVKNSLVPPPIPPSPFAHRSDAPLIFPRSVNPASNLPRFQSLASTAFKRRLLARLEADNRPLTPVEQASISSLASRRVSALVPVARPPHPFNESAPSRTTVISLSSPGLTRWISRPCFEERYVVFVPQEDGAILRKPVSGTASAVAALEFSEALEAMVDFDQQDIPPPSSSLFIEVPPPVSETVSAPPSASGHTRTSPHITVPSPLRNEHNPPPPPPTLVVSQSAPPAVPAPAAAADPLVKRGVRFAEDDKDDVIPIGYVLRMKKRREEKARFLQAEQQRRQLAEERRRIEAERRRRDAERAAWEAERRAWEEEKRAMEEERRLRKYAEEVAAARLRRESQRAGGVPALQGTENNGFLGNGGSAAGFFPSSVSSSASERNKAAAHRQSRAMYQDAPALGPRREASEPNLPTITRTGPSTPAVPITYSHSSSHSHSPGSSCPPSVRGTPPSVESSLSLPGAHSPAMYSSQEEPSSSEDVKAAVAAAAMRAKRNSFASTMSRNNSSGSLGGSYPAWTGSNHSLNMMVTPVPPVPVMPMQMQMMPVPAFVMMDTPLLPPTPPFMMQRYPRQSGSARSTGSGAASFKGRLPSSQNSSREKVNVVNGMRPSGAVSPSGHPPRSASFPRPEYRPSSSSTPTSPQKSSQHGHGSTSGEPRRASMPATSPGGQQHHSGRPRQHSDQRPPHPQHSHSQPSSMPRVTSSQHLQLPSPWTGIPTQSGALPNAHAMPPRQHSQSSMRGGTTSTKAKRQTMIS
ncbi:hypothetical protein LshimejAT787_0107810 [Lyophyllum shimeji]|uniref:Uncharacterized protein n=1 Tax=Lyophyllum shimeji TaxID=47721 RepID=A0A9P3UI96_LYOSH|nr:hypothetical protein LshimejAT787_0107810 [Lyophyllum shimeji]